MAAYPHRQLTPEPTSAVISSGPNVAPTPKLPCIRFIMR